MSVLSNAPTLCCDSTDRVIAMADAKLLSIQYTVPTSCFIPPPQPPLPTFLAKQAQTHLVLVLPIVSLVESKLLPSLSSTNSENLASSTSTKKSTPSTSALPWPDPT